MFPESSEVKPHRNAGAASRRAAPSVYRYGRRLRRGVNAASRNIGPELQTGSRAKRAGSVFSATYADGIRRAVPPLKRGKFSDS